MSMVPYLILITNFFIIDFSYNRNWILETIMEREDFYFVAESKTIIKYFLTKQVKRDEQKWLKLAVAVDTDVIAFHGSQTVKR